MKRSYCIIVFFAAISLNSFSQSKPELPTDFYDKLSYTLPVGFNYNDSVQLISEIKKIASELLKWDNNALDNYIISDSAYRYYFLTGYGLENLILGNYNKAVAYINESRLLRKSSDYVLPDGLFELAYSNACIKHADDGSPAFRNSYSKILIEEFNKLNPSFRNDIVNQSKGTYTSMKAVV